MKNTLKYLTVSAAAVIAVGALLLFTPISGFTQVREGSSTQAKQLTGTTTPIQTQSGAGLESLQSSLRSVAARVLPTVVEINVTAVITQKVPQFSFPFDFPFPFNQQPQGNGGERKFQQSGLGSGIIVQRAGDRYYVLTNNHVVKDAT
ncbi:MAG TPA: serine protease, partial [Spirochaetia bacterium]|nr:serine protease [Spirochaetia bacterium]